MKLKTKFINVFRENIGMTKKFSVGLLSFMIMLSLLAPVVNANDFQPNPGTTKDAEEKADAATKLNTETPKTIFDDKQGGVLEIGPEIIGQPVGAAANPTVNKVSIGDKTVSGTTLGSGQRRARKLDVIIHVSVSRQAGGTEEKTVTIPYTNSKSKWEVTLDSELAEGDKVTVKQEYGGDISDGVTLEVKKSLANQHNDKLKMPAGEIWIEETSANIVNDDEQAEAIEMLKKANPDIAKDFGSVKFSINGTDHAYYEVTYTDGSTSGKIEATDLIIKQVTEKSATPTIEKVQVTDGQIIVTLDKEVAAGTKFYFIKNFTDGQENNFCEGGSCIADKSESEDKSQEVTVDGKKVTFPIRDKVKDLKLGKEFGIVVKEPHKFRSCAKSEPVVTTPQKVDVRDPHKLTDADKKAIDKSIRDANTVNGVSKLPNGTGYLTDPAFIEFDKDGNVTIISPNDVETDWDSNGNPIYAKNPDGTYKLKDGAKVTKFPAKDLVKNIKPDAPTLALSKDKKNITITPNLKVDTDAETITVSYKDKDGKNQTTKATKADDGTWSITKGEGSVDTNGVITLPRNKVKGETDVTATVTDKGGIADDDTTPLTSDSGTLTVKETKADKVEALGGLDPVNLKKWVGDKVDWKKGVKAKDSATDENKEKIKELLDEATTFADENSRGTTAEGDFTGKIKVTFEDESFIEVKDQKLYVSNHVTSMNRKDKVPTDALDVELKLGEGVKVEDKDPNSGEVTKTTKGDKNNPVIYKEYKVKPGTDFSSYEHPTLKKTIFDLIDEKADGGYTEPVWAGQDTNNPKNFVVSDTNKVFTATATKTYDITFDANTGGGTKDKVTQKVNTEYELPAKDTFTPPNENQEFSGWQVGEDTTLKQPGAKITISGDTVVKAIWKPIEVKVKFQTEAGASGTMEDKTVNKGSKYELPKPTFTPEEGKEFAGWKVGDGTELKQVGKEIDISGDVTLTATWKDIEYKVTFNGNTGTGKMDEKLVKKGKEYELPENRFTAPEGKKFDGWMVGTEKKAVGTKITVNADTEVKAIWKDKTSSGGNTPGTGNDNPGTGNPNNGNTPGGNPGTPGQTPGQPGSQNPGNVGTNPESEQLIIKFDANGGKWTDNDIVKYVEAKRGDNITILKAPTREGYVFDYWKGSKYQPGDTYNVQGSHTFVAQWKPVAKNAGPNTGDNGMNMLYAFGLALAACGVIVINRIYRKVK